MIDRAAWRPIQGLGELVAHLRTARSDGVFRWGISEDHAQFRVSAGKLRLPQQSHAGF